MTRILGTKELTAANPGYSVSEKYERFNQKYNMIYQGEWNPDAAHISDEQWHLSRVNKLRKNVPGFTRLDWAYYSALVANLASSNFVVNRPNTGGTAWAPMVKQGYYKN